MEFWKGHALGNDYIVLDGTGADAPGGALIRALCDRHQGVGGDGVLVAELSEEPAGLRIFNPDGSEAEKSGNGLRIFGAWLHERGRVAEAEEFAVRLADETVAMTVQESAADGARTLRVDMGRPSFAAGDVGFSGKQEDARETGDREGPCTLELEDGPVEVHLVSVGNPHCVVFVDDLEVGRFRATAPVIQAHPWFERGVNVQFARVVSPTTVEARIWERGAGETLASGSSACAIVAAALRAELASGSEIEVRMPGGVVTVEVDRERRLHLTGEARIVYRGEVSAGVVSGWRAP